MLINFSITNWMSFRDSATLTTVASKERQHGDRLPRIKKYPLRVLPITAIYGGNASGKTNLFQAIKFAKYLIVEGTQPENLIPRDYFRLDSNSPNNPTEFVFDILVEDTVYQYSFSITSFIVVEEKLVEILSTRDKIIFHRYDGKPHFNSTLAKDNFLKFAFKGTRNNQLFLTNTVNQQIEHFKPIYDWFKYSLELIAPDDRFQPFEQFIDENDPLFNTMNQILAGLDTGITRLGNEEIKLENINISDLLKIKLQAKLKEGESVKIQKWGRQEPIIITRKNGQLIANKLISYHRYSQHEKIPSNINIESNRRKSLIDSQEEIPSNIHQESDGRERIIDSSPQVYYNINIESGGRKNIIDSQEEIPFNIDIESDKGKSIIDSQEEIPSNIHQESGGRKRAIDSQQQEIPFNIYQESDGTKRIIDLIPVLLELINPHSKKVFIIDEIDRSLHTLLTRNLLETYLNKCSPETRSQLLFTTHDLLLMEQKLLRRDEMWITERDNSGNSTLIGFSEYDDIRYDKDIRKSYLQGRMGGIPHLLPPATLSTMPSQTLTKGKDKK